MQASKAQNRAMDLQQSALAADQAFRQQLYADYQKNYGPLEQKLIQEASSEQPLNLGPNWARIQSNFDTAARNNETSLARKGMLGSGLDVNNNLESNRAYALDNAFSQGLQNRQALRLQLLNAGKQMPQQAGFASQGNQQMAGFYGQQAALYGNMAAGAGQGLSSSLGALGYALGNYQPPPPPPTVNTAMTGMPDMPTAIMDSPTWIDPSLLRGPSYPSEALMGSPTWVDPRLLSGLSYPSAANMGSAYLPSSSGFSASSLGGSPITGPADK
jgi:hypothetical protein